MQILLKNAMCFISGELVASDVLIERKKIKKIASSIPNKQAKVIDCEGHLLSPGFIDVHVHLREPGGEHKETIYSGTKAAAKGGFTTICSMPNTSPVPDHVEQIEELFNLIKEKAQVRVLPYASITKNLEGKQLTPIDQLAKLEVFAFTDDGVGIQSADMMLQAMKLAAKEKKAIVAHCEDETLIYDGVVHLGEVSERLNLPGIPSTCESVQIARDVLLAEQANCHYHVCHVSTKESVRVIRDAKAAGINVTAEVTPHHLLLNEEDIKEADPNFKMNPPLRSKEDQQALIRGLLDGTIDMIATDHAPHATEEKAKGMLEAPFGIVGLETAFPLLYTHFVIKDILPLEQLIMFLTERPAKVFNLPFGKLEEGALADVTLIDLEKEKKIIKEHFYSKAENTPFNQWKVKGVPRLTIVEGKIVYDEFTK